VPSAPWKRNRLTREASWKPKASTKRPDKSQLI
jgi:hypothetical protein